MHLKFDEKQLIILSLLYVCNALILNFKATLNFKFNQKILFKTDKIHNFFLNCLYKRINFRKKYTFIYTKNFIKPMKKQFLQFYLIFATTVFVSCNFDSNQEFSKSMLDSINTDDVNIDSIIERSEAGIDSLTFVESLNSKSLVYTKYKLPLPVELYRFLKSKKVKFNKELLNPIENVENYHTIVSKAINLGFYSSDLAYCTVFGQNQESLVYFFTTKDLSGELNISVGYSQATIDQFNANLENTDSLYKIATNGYWKTCNYLEGNQDVNVLPFIIVGTWIESIHLAVNSSDKNTKKQVMQIVAHQKESLNNLIQYIYDTMLDMKVFKVNNHIQRVAGQLKDLQFSFDKIKAGEKSMEVSEEVFNEISSKIQTIRSYYIK